MGVFSCKTKILSGDGAVSALGELGIRRLYLVADPFFVKNGVAQQVGNIAKAEAVEIFSEVTPDPSVELAAKATARLREFGADTVVALGGGSTMDCAKAMVYFSGMEVQLVAIPTTSGSGSEVTDFAILTHNGVKHPLVDEKLRPSVAILDGNLLRQLPKALIAEGGFDALCHAVESFVATGAGTMSEALAEAAFRTVFSALTQSFAGRTEVRMRIHEAATMAGLAFTHSGLGLCHAMAHALGGVFHIPHGRLNGILLPEVLDCNAHGAAAKYAKLARSAGLGGSADTLGARNLKNALVRLRRELEMPQTLLQAGVNPGEVYRNAKAIVEATLADPCCKTNPVPVEDFMVRRILEAVTGRV